MRSLISDWITEENWLKKVWLDKLELDQTKSDPVNYILHVAKQLSGERLVNADQL